LSREREIRSGTSARNECAKSIGVAAALTANREVEQGTGLQRGFPEVTAAARSRLSGRKSTSELRQYSRRSDRIEEEHLA
jgi:hypothetical protein